MASPDKDAGNDPVGADEDLSVPVAVPDAMDTTVASPYSPPDAAGNISGSLATVGIVDDEAACYEG